MENRLFIYGTLQPGERNVDRMEGVEPEGVALTKEAVFTLAEFQSTHTPGQVSPSVLEGGEERIRGHLVMVSDELLKRLHDFEGPDYIPTLVELDDGKTAIMYLHNSKSDKEPHLPTATSPSGIVREDGIARWSQPKQATPT